VKQDVRGRGGSGGVLDMNAMQEQDGYDAVEWAAALPGSNGKVGMIGRSNPGLYCWYAAIAQPPHLATIAPAVAAADPLRLVPYIDTPRRRTSDRQAWSSASPSRDLQCSLDDPGRALDDQ
jgi:putative CocE/NonD family hydrolase